MIHVLIPAAGASRRFVEAGYPVKALVDVLGKSMMQRVIENVRPLKQHRVTVVSQVPLPGVDADVVLAGRPTLGSVDSILMADILDGEPLLLVNQDQLVDLDIDVFIASAADGAIATFRSTKPHHSYVTVDGQGHVARIVEKEVISNQAVTGIYFFRDGGVFRRAAERVLATDMRVLGEFYVSTVLAAMVGDGYRFTTSDCATAILGTPEELQLFLAAARVAEVAL